jgi:phosphoadenosine phosphosulfate reductase
MNSTATQYVKNSNVDHYSKNPEGFLKWIVEKLPNDKVVMGTGFGPPGIVLLDMLFKVTNNISVFYIDTSFLFEQTYDLKKKLEEKYGFKFLRFSTELTPEAQGKQYGEKLWENDPDACCNLRKVLPMNKALADYDFWITGIRKKQTAIRSSAGLVELEPRFSVIKMNPLLNWTHDEVWNYIKEHDLPYNELHDRNYPSIGCKQCTSPVCSGDDERSGRWTGTNKIECGLHQSTKISSNETKTKAN